VLAWTLQMAMALLACKSRLGMVHGDVKLLNFMLVANGTGPGGAPKALTCVSACLRVFVCGCGCGWV
jgi:hypothetical protein